MNALPFVVDAPLTVEMTDFIVIDGAYSELHARLSDGRVLVLSWDPQYGYFNRRIDGVDLTAEETGLSREVVDDLEAELYRNYGEERDAAWDSRDEP